MFSFFRKKKSDKIRHYLNKNAQLLDVRNATEFNNSHIEESIHIPVQMIEQKLDLLDKNRPVIVYCAYGGRSNIAAAKLKSKGFTVFNAGSINSVRKKIKQSL